MREEASGWNGGKDGWETKDENDRAKEKERERE